MAIDIEQSNVLDCKIEVFSKSFEQKTKPTYILLHIYFEKKITCILLHFKTLIIKDNNNNYSVSL